MNKVTVVGSLNVDTTMKIKRMPLPGETIAAMGKSSAAGGKGANQAVSAARSGAQTSFVGEVGKDNGGQMMLKDLQDNGIDVSGIRENDQVGTGSAAILLDENGQNSILVYGGANQQLSVEDVEAAKKQIVSADFVVAQFETPQAATLRAFQLAKENGVTTILNPAPAQKIDIQTARIRERHKTNQSNCATSFN